MDNKKIGKLIAKLRNEKGLTQQDLGDKIGVGFRAVSKWERGITLPDISNINELSKILGITSDELLSGELKENNEPKVKKKIPLKITISIIISLITIFIFLFINYNNKTYVYSIASTNEKEYMVKGVVNIQKDNISIALNELKFIDKNFSSTIIKNYEYDIYVENEFLFGYGYNPESNHVEENVEIKELCKSFKINYVGKTKIERRKLIKSDIKIILYFTDINDNQITKEIKFRLKPANIKK